MSPRDRKPGDRVQVTARCREYDYQAGDKGVVRHGPTLIRDGWIVCYAVAMDKDASRPVVLFTADEIEPDV
jgi:hypothetical protein